MGKITFVAHDNTEHVAEFEAGVSLMQIAVDNAIPGIDGDCGGECACGTCHVHVDPAFADALPAMSEDENDLLDSSDGRDETSRLSCQIQLTSALDGLKVRIAEED